MPGRWLCTSARAKAGLVSGSALSEVQYGTTITCTRAAETQRAEFSGLLVAVLMAN